MTNTVSVFAFVPILRSFVPAENLSPAAACAIAFEFVARFLGGRCVRDDFHNDLSACGTMPHQQQENALKGVAERESLPVQKGTVQADDFGHSRRLHLR